MSAFPLKARIERLDRTDPINDANLTLFSFVIHSP
jgi:hypothetical protein